MITITIQDFKKYTNLSKDWIVSKCSPVSNAVSHRGLCNVYDAERVLARAKRNLSETEANHNLAGSKKASATKTLRQIITGIELYIETNKAQAAS